MQRRSYLALTATALSTAAGCTSLKGSLGSNSNGNNNDNDDDGGASAAADGTVTIDDITLQPAAILDTDDGITAHDLGQYLFVNVTVDSGEVGLKSYTMRFSGAESGALTGEERENLWRVQQSPPYDPKSGGLVVFRVAGATDAIDVEAVLETPDGEHELDDQMKERMAQRTSFESDLVAPETVGVDESLSLEVSIQNGGTTPTRFVGAVSRTGPDSGTDHVTAFRPLLGGNEHKTVAIDEGDVASETPNGQVGDDQPDIEYTLNAIGENDTASVRVVE